MTASFCHMCETRAAGPDFALCTSCNQDVCRHLGFVVMNDFVCCDCFPAQWDPKLGIHVT